MCRPYFLTLLMCLLLSTSNIAHAKNPGDSIGRVIITTTNLVAKQTDGSTRALRNTSEVYQGDTLVTGADGMAQLRMVDGSVFSLRKETEFKIAEFSFNLEQNTQERGLFNLIRGGFRTITGLLGKRANSNYKVTTAAATIGIRGTHYGLRLCQNGDCKDEGINQDGLYGGVVDGEIIAENLFGSSNFGNDQYFFVAGWDKQALGILTPPGVVFSSDKTGGNVKNKSKVAANNTSAANTSPETRQRVGQQIRKMIHDNRQQGENLNASKQLTPAKAGTVAALSTLYIGDAGLTYGQAPATRANPNMSIDTDGGLILLRPDKSLGAMAWPDSDGLPGPYFHAKANAKLRNVGSKPGLGVSWGRWDNNWETKNENGSNINQIPTASAHYIMSNNVITTAQLGALMGNIDYAPVIGGTQPTDMQGNVGKIEALSIGVNFDTVASVTAYSLKLSFFNGNEIVDLSKQAAGNVALTEAMKGNLDISGTCSSTRCVGANLNGKASLNLIGSNAGAAMTSFSAAGTGVGGIPLGYNGTALVAPDPTPP